MIIKIVAILAVTAACYAIPVEEALKPVNAAFIAMPVEEKAPLKQPATVVVPTDDKAKEDLKTDNSLWWSSYYKYPVYSKYHYDTYDYDYIPRVKTYEYSYYEPYTYWRSYW
ncbi:uncharacterized protein LOC128677941 [Plodia interpunctella]|uniref:uncharacterized protein LOC128677941 n=1 Tax=Plodia interpunctella TaxID=58824 RepID=UPI0023685878|nr:uncharacterized protein LOC128677941 [Plodia interpunctella]